MIVLRYCRFFSSIISLCGRARVLLSRKRSKNEKNAPLCRGVPAFSKSRYEGLTEPMKEAQKIGTAVFHRMKQKLNLNGSQCNANR
jgi:hypothetical protein